jgi:hypothetical protein
LKSREVVMTSVRDFDQGAAVRLLEEMCSNEGRRSGFSPTCRSGTRSSVFRDKFRPANALEIFELLSSLPKDFMPCGSDDEPVDGLQVENWSI